MRWGASIAGMTLSLLSASGILATDVMPLAEIRPGQLGHGVTVTSGTETVEFQVEILGVVKNRAPGSSYILARLSGADLENSGVVAGMSGSPVYLDGRLAGAVAFSWSFSQEPLAGIRPAEEMLAIRDLPDASGASGGGALDLSDLASAAVPEDFLEVGLETLMPAVPAGGTAPILWAGSGFGPLSEGLLSSALGPVSPAGTGSIEEGRELAPGDAVAVVLMRGDLQMAATGTVTDRQGESILAFGHPFLGLGGVALPMASAEVVAVVPNLFQSFKVTNLGPVVGAWEQDRVAGMAGRVGGSASLIPVSVTVRSDLEERFEIEVARLPSLAPVLMGIGVLAALETVGRVGGELSLDLELVFRLRDHEDLKIQQSFEGATAAMEVGLYTSAFAAYLLDNPLADVEIQGVEVELLQRRQPVGAFVLAAHLGNGVVRPGEEVVLDVSLKPFQGAVERRQVPIRLPSDLASGRYILLVGDGVSVDSARINLQPFIPQRIGQALRYLRTLHSRRNLVVLGIQPAPGLRVAGESLPLLPESARSIWEASGARNAPPLTMAVRTLNQVVDDLPLSGLVRLDLTVRRPEVLTQDDVKKDKGTR